MVQKARAHFGVLVLVSLLAGASFSVPAFALASGLPNECPTLEEYNIIEGTSDADTIEGTAGNDFIDAKGGDDVINGNGGGDCILGGGGDDTITTGDGNDVIFGGSGNDTINAGEGNNIIFGEGDSDTIWTGSGDDEIYGGGDGDTISAGEGRNVIQGDGGDDVITAGSGNDDIRGGGGKDTIDAGDGDNVVRGDGDGDIITTGSGNDEIYGGGGDDTINAGEGNNTIHGDGGEDIITGGPGNDVIDSGGGVDTIDAGDGDDVITSGGGEDAVTDGLGCDVIDGAPAVCGYVWSDTDADGTRDEAEAFVGWDITLFDDIGEVVSSLLSDANGFFEFNALQSGDYLLCAKRPEGGSWLQTFPAENEECGEGYFASGYMLTLDEGDALTDSNFGNHEAAAPAASPAAGEYTMPQGVALSAASIALTILYTTDGTDPACAPEGGEGGGEVGSIYESPIPLIATKTIKAVTCYEDGVVSPIGEYLYTIEKIELGSEQISDLVAKNIFVPTAAATSTPVVVQVVQKVVLSVSGTNGTSTVALPKDVVISRADGENLDATLLTAAETATSSLSNLGSGTVFEGALQWGMATTTLEFSAPITLSIYVGEALDGQTLDIMRSPDGTSGWTSDGIVSPATCTVANGTCAFQAVKASVYAAARPPVVSSGGGGGGGGFTDTTPPGSPAVSLVIAKETATSGAATLALSAEDAYEMIVADNADFGGAAWERYNKEKPWVFAPESGTTTVYVKFRDVSNNETETVSAIWSEELAAEAVSPDEVATSTPIAEEEPAPSAALEGSSGAVGAANQTESAAQSEGALSVAPRYVALRYDVVPAPPAPPLLAALDGVFGTSALNFSLVMLSSLFGAAFYGAYDLIRARFF